MSETPASKAPTETPATPSFGVGDGSRPPLPPMPAPKRGMARRINVATRAPFLPDHDHARQDLKAHPPELETD